MSPLPETGNLAERAARRFARLGGTIEDPPVLMPASLPLELSGEAVRARLCVFSDSAGLDWALRPDLTLAIAVDEAERRVQARDDRRPSCRRYVARAFRLPAAAGDPLEFTQVGFERFAAEGGAAVDAEVFLDVLGATRETGAPIGRIWLGDLSVFPAFVDALDLAPGVAEAAKRAFRQQGGVQALLDPETGPTAGRSLSARLRGASRSEAEAMVADMLDLAGVSPVGERGLDEIVEGLLERAAAADTGGIPREAAEVLRAVLAVEAPPEVAASDLAAIASAAGLRGVEPVLADLSDRLSHIIAEAPDALAEARFGTPFGRRFNYYDGFLFEIFAPGAPNTRPMAAGGRYDRLLSRLSDGEISATGIGGVVRPDRLRRAIEEAAG